MSGFKLRLKGKETVDIDVDNHIDNEELSSPLNIVDSESGLSDPGPDRLGPENGDSGDESIEDIMFEEIEGPVHDSIEEGQQSNRESGIPNLKIIDSDDEDSENSGSSKRGSKRSNRFFYRVANHQELFKVGRSFYKDYVAGVKSFAITSTGYQSSQQNSILGIASFFDHKEEDLKIGIISDNLYLGSFKKVIDKCSKVEVPLYKVGISCEGFNFYDHFEFIDLRFLLELSQNDEVEDYESVYDSIIDHYDIVFWDVPELHVIQEMSEQFFPIIMKFESLSIIVAQKLSSSDEIEEVRKFFLGYGINLKSLMMDKRPEASLNEDESKKKKKWWRIF